MLRGAKRLANTRVCANYLFDRIYLLLCHWSLQSHSSYITQGHRVTDIEDVCNVLGFVW